MARHDKIDQDNTPDCSSIFSIMMRTQRGHRTREQDLEAKRQRRGRPGQCIAREGNDLINNVCLIHGNIRSTETIQHPPASRLDLIKIHLCLSVCDLLTPQTRQDNSNASVRPPRSLRIYDLL